MAFDPNEYLAQKEGIAPAPVDQLAVQQFDPNSYLQGKEIQAADILQAQYGTASEQAKAALEGALRGASLGASDQALVASGISDPKSLKGRKEANPLTEFGAKLFGGAAAIGLTGGLAAPVEAGLAGAGSTAARIGAFGAEGAAFGLGDLISEEALGDAKFNADNVISHLGMGFGGGALLGGLSKVIGVLPSMARKRALKNVPEGMQSVEKALQAEGLGTRSSQVVEDALNLENKNRKPNWRDIQRAGDELGIDTPIGSLANDHYQKQQFTTSTSPTAEGQATHAIYKNAYDSAAKVISDTLGAGENSLAEVGQNLQSSLSQAFERKYEPIAEIYGQINKLAPEIPVTLETRNELGSRLQSIIKKEGYYKGSSNRGFVEGAMNALPDLENLDSLMKFKSAIQEAGRDNFGQNGRVAGLIRDEIDEVEQYAIQSLSRQLKGTPQGAAIEALTPQLEQARAAYKVFREDIKKVSKQVWGDSKVYGHADFLNKIAEETPEKFASKLFNKKDSRSLKWMAENFPEETRLLSQYQRDLIRRNASRSKNGFNPLLATKEILDDKNFPKEIRNIVFSPEEIKTFKNGKLYLDNFLPNFNPSGTSTIEGYRRFYDWVKHPIATPISIALENARDIGANAYTKFRTGLGHAEQAEFAGQAAKAGALNSLKNTISNSVRNLDRATDAIFKTTSSPAARGAALSGITDFADKNYHEHVEKIQELSSNPEALMDYLSQQTAGISQVAPQMGQQLSNTAVQALMYLNAQIPKKGGSMLLSTKYEPSSSEKIKFERAYHVVTQPMSVLKQLKDGTLTRDSMKAMEAVHPALLNQMRQKVIERLNAETIKKLPYAVRSSLTLFLRTPLDENQTPLGVQLNQNSFAMPQAGNQGAPQQGSRGVKFKVPDTTATRTARKPGE